MGVLPEHHRQGAGRALVAKAEDALKRQGCRYLIVKTLSETADYEPYERTRKFYKSAGFEELVTLTEMWSPENPCLIMIKSLGAGAMGAGGPQPNGA